MRPLLKNKCFEVLLLIKKLHFLLNKKGIFNFLNGIFTCALVRLEYVNVLDLSLLPSMQCLKTMMVLSFRLHDFEQGLKCQDTL